MLNNFAQHKKRILTGLTLLSMAACPVYAAVQPDAGIVLGGNKQPVLQQPVHETPQITVEGQKAAAENGGGQRIAVSSFRITGALPPVPQEELLALVASEAGRELTLTDLNNLAAKITQHLRQQGYLVANGYIPAQAVKDGVVEIAVIIGRYGKIDIQNHSGLKTAVAVNFLSGLNSGDYVQKDKLDRTLLFLNDLSGVSVKATLVPGVDAGTSDLVVAITDTAKINGQTYADNWGNCYTGKNRLGVSLNINDFSGRGDLLNVGGVYAGSGMYNYSTDYLIPTGGEGAKFGVGYSQMHYLLGNTFAPLGASGVSKTTSLYETFALKRSRDFNLNARVEYDNKLLKDQIDRNASDNRKRAEVWVFGLSGDSRDNFGGGGVNSFSLTYEKGDLSLDSGDAVASDANAKAGGSFGKTEMTGRRLQYINDRLTLYASFTGQLSDKNLDSSEKLQLGGPTGVRAYPVGEASCDEGYLFTGEFRWNLPKPNFQLAAFYDNGKARINKNSWAGAGENKRVLAGAGLGLIWNSPDGYAVRLDYAWKITTDNPAASAPDDNGRVWLQTIKYF
ncbi:MAG: ShlB/FhaC/HecB family hemolysin secretion/activation protein [Veillonellales bacterium]